jgi:Chaperone of endosialidase
MIMKKMFFILILSFNTSAAVFSQKVGINTSQPLTTLDVRGTGYFSDKLGLGISNPQFPLSFSPTLGDKISLWGNSGPNYGLGIQSYLLQVYTDASASDIGFGYGSSASFTENMRIKGNGKVGIGTANPGAKFHVASGSSGYAGGYFPGMILEGNGAAYFNFLAPNNSESGILFGKASDIVSGGIIYNNSGNPNSLQLRTNGNITRMIIYNNGNAWLQGALIQASDARLKKDITLLRNPLQKIIQLNGYTYHWKNETADNNLQTGVLAQEVQKLFPELVTENKDGLLAVNYSGLIPVLIESIKEQQKQIDKLNKIQLQMQEQLAKLKK